MIKSIIFFILVGLYTTSAHAGHSDYLKSLTDSAREKGLGKESVELLLPLPGPGKEKAATKLRGLLVKGTFGAALTVKLDKPTQQGKKAMSYVTDKGSLEVFADGSRFRLRGNMDTVKPLPSGNKLPLAAGRLEKLGRDFVQQQLKAFVAIPRGEKLTFLGTKYLRQGGSDLQGKRRSEELFANIAIFGREVGGVPVVGSGSKIAVWFNPSGQVIGADVDWPKYKRSGQNVPLLSREALFKRVEAATASFAGSKENKMTRFECGYVDLGATRRAVKTPIQPGCSVAYQGFEPDSAATIWAKVEYVPAALKVIPDNRWPLATFIARSGEPEPGKSIPVPGDDPPKDAPLSSVEPKK